MNGIFVVSSPGDGANPFLGMSKIGKLISGVSQKDKHLLRELAKVYMELTAQEINQERIQRIRDIHSLKPVRPPVWVDEIPWHEMDIDNQLALHCETEEARILEQFFRRILFQWKYFQADMVVEDTLYLIKSYTNSGIGIAIQEDTLSIDSNNPIVSHQYKDQLDTDEKIEALKVPVIQALPEIDKRNFEILSDIFEGIMPIRLRGHGVYYAPWDMIAQYRGVQNCLTDILEQPELLHKTIQKFTEIGVSVYAQMEDQGLLDYHIKSLHCTPPYTNELPAQDYDGGTVRRKDIWFRGMAQPFTMVSPAMRDEFDLHYMRPLMEQFGLSYYGCCEPLDTYISYLKKVPNMRKIGLSPWANLRSAAEQIGGNYVVARKPNPALVAMGYNPEAVTREIRDTIEACIENKCPYEFVLKDISTVGYKPHNLIDWVNTVKRVIDPYYQ